MSQLYEEMQQDFLERCQQVEDGYLSYLEASVQNKLEADYLMQLVQDRKDWMSENLDNIETEADQYGKEGYKGLLFKKQTRETLSFKHIPEWLKIEAEKKDLESKSKAALQMVRKGGLNVDENGVEIPLPEVSVSSFLKVDKVR